MRIIDTVVERENQALKEFKKCEENGYPTYILGDGEGADNVEKRFKDFSFEGRLVNKKYYKEKDNVFCLEDFLEKDTNIVNLVVAYKGFSPESLAEWNDKIAILIDKDIFAGNCSVDSELMTYEYVKKNVDKLNSVFSLLGDDFSRVVLSSYINQKISSEYKYLKGVKTFPQYFEEGILTFSENEVFVDCGAYDGDSAVAFIKALKKNGIEHYKKIISFEPDPINFEKLVKRGLPNHECINKGTSDQSGEMAFFIQGTSSKFDPNGDVVVPIDTLDNLVKEKVTFIKMDIEGEELAALSGASILIKNCKPSLAICVYHKKEDLWEIPLFLKSLVPEYNFALRAYEDTATELVLYAWI